LFTAVARYPVGVVVLADVAGADRDAVVVVVEAFIVGSAVLLRIAGDVDASGVSLEHKLALDCRWGALASVCQLDFVVVV
jgi:hypothetical protein